jgi:hypothetical protein
MTFNQSLIRLFQAGNISARGRPRRVGQPDELKMQMRGITRGGRPFCSPVAQARRGSDLRCTAQTRQNCTEITAGRRPSLARCSRRSLCWGSRDEKLPFNFLLYTLSLGLLGGVGWVFYQATFEAPKHQKKNKEIQDRGRAAGRSGQKRQPGEKFWFYGDQQIKGQETDAWWSKLFLTNRIGKLPPEPVKADTRPTTKATSASATRR